MNTMTIKGLAGVSLLCALTLSTANAQGVDSDASPATDSPATRQSSSATQAPGTATDRASRPGANGSGDENSMNRHIERNADRERRQRRETGGSSGSAERTQTRQQDR